MADIEKQALSKRQELRIAGLSIEKASEGIALAELQTKPMFKLDLMTIETGEALMPDALGSGKNPFTIGFGVTIPWSGLKNSSKVREAQQNHEAVKANKHSLEDATRVALRKIYFRLENARRLVELYETTLIPQAGAAIEVAETWHQEGPKSITGFLETQSVWLNFNLARLRAIADYQQNLARLEQLVGERSMIHILRSRDRLLYLFAPMIRLFRHIQHKRISKILYRCLFHYWKWSIPLFISFTVSIVLVSGCANQSTGNVPRITWYCVRRNRRITIRK